MRNRITSLKFTIYSLFYFTRHRIKLQERSKSLQTGTDSQSLKASCKSQVSRINELQEGTELI